MSTCIVVTGAAGALGASTARRLAKSGAGALALVDSAHHRDRLEALAKELGTGRAFTGDLSDANESAALFLRITSELGAPRCAALIAGGYAGGAPFWEAGPDVLSQMMRSNFDSVAHALRAMLPAMVAAKHGRIVVIGSRNVEQPWTGAGSAAYTAAKSAVVALVRAIAAETRAHDVTLNALLISTLDTPANRAAMPAADPAKWVPLDAAAKQIESLLADDAREISGAAIPLYGRA